MKKYLLYLTATFLTAHLAAAQVLYTEDFDNLTVGNVGTDITGQTPGQAGWYTLGGGGSSGTTFITDADFQITLENTKGNILTIKETPSTTHDIGRNVYRSDIETIWNQRIPGNDILKLVFELYTGPVTTGEKYSFIFFSYGSQQRYIFCNFVFDVTTKTLQLPVQYLKNNVALLSSGQKLNGNSDLILLSDTWVAVELYIDYTGSKYYVSVLSLSHTVAFDFGFPMALTDPVNEGDPVNGTPKRLYFVGSTLLNSIYYETKFDNINISATNTAPTVSVKDFISDKFNVFHNPVADIVTITNSENIAIKEIAIYDINGKHICTYPNLTKYEMQVNVQELNSGTYFLHITTDKGLGIKKMIKK